MKQNWTMYIYKADRRKKTGERAVSTTVWLDRDLSSMQREARELLHMYPLGSGHRFEFHPLLK